MGHADGYRYFVSYSTGEDDLPVTTNDPSYFRVLNTASDSFPAFMAVYFWNQLDWMYSILQPFCAHLDDVLGSGATVRELLDEKDVPHA